MDHVSCGVGKGMFFVSFVIGKGMVLKLAAARPHTKFFQEPPQVLASNLAIYMMLNYSQLRGILGLLMI